MERLILIGAGALALDVYEQFAGDRTFCGALVDPEYAGSSRVPELPLLTDWDQAAQIATHYVLAIADIEQRRRMRTIARNHGLEAPAPLISARANVSRSSTIGAGCVVGPFCWIGAQARLAADCLLMNHIIAGHDCDIEENVVFCPGANFAGYTRIGANSFVGSNAVIPPNIRIGSGSFIAAGAACLRDAAEGSFLIGNPARAIAR